MSHERRIEEKVNLYSSNIVLGQLWNNIRNLNEWFLNGYS